MQDYTAWRGRMPHRRKPLTVEQKSRQDALRALAKERKKQRLDIENHEEVQLARVNYERGLGVLLPIFSLPSAHGIGTLGTEATRFADFLQASGVRYWQILPLNPTGYGNSPYAGLSSWAGNPNLIDLDTLSAEGLLSPDDFTELDAALAAWYSDRAGDENAAASAEASDQPSSEEGAEHPENAAGERVTGEGKADRVAYEIIAKYRPALLRKAWKTARERDKEARKNFLKENAYWLKDYALFVAIKEAEDGRAWQDWPEEFRRRDPEALKRFAAEHPDDLEYIYWEQFQFYQQWECLKNYVNGKGIQIIGDIPIYVALDSADAWVHTGIFQLDEDLRPLRVAGAPPDMFTDDGQLWGNPLYNWDELAKEKHAFWISRLAHSMRLYNVIRLDHFIGFSRYWSVPAGDETARNGVFVQGPGLEFFRAAEKALGPLPILVEDLGVVEESVIRLRKQTGFPGMRPIEFAFGDEDSEYLPHNFIPRTSVYTSTHDSDTLYGWWEDVASPEEKQKVTEYFGLDEQEGMVWGILRGVCSSVAELCIFSMQDLLMLGNEARMNRPGLLDERNWSWRLTRQKNREELAEELRAMAIRYGRI